MQDQKSKAFWSELEVKIGTISSTVKSVLVLNGFNNLLALSAVQSHEINEITEVLEKSVRELNDDSCWVQEINLHDKPNSAFSFLIGEKCELKNVFEKTRTLSPVLGAEASEIDDMLSELKRRCELDHSLIDSVRSLTKDNRNEEVINKLLKESSIGFERSNEGNRFSDLCRKVCALILIKAGPSAYNFLSSNSSIPTVRSVKAMMYQKYRKIDIGQIYAKELKSFLEEMKLPLSVCVAEDATRVKSALAYDHTLKEVIGIVTPARENGLPNHEDAKAETPLEILNIIRKYKKALFIQVIIAKSIKKGAPSFVLGVFPTNNEYIAAQVTARWKFILRELNNQGIEVIAFSSDGAPALLNGMKGLNGFGNTVSCFNYSFPLEIQSYYPCIQDPIHLINKFKNRLLDDLIDLWIGNHLATANDLLQLFESNEWSKNDHGLHYSDVASNDMTKDKMDFNSTLRICDWKVINILRNTEGCEGTAMYLTLMRYLVEALILEETPLRQRLYNMFFVVRFVRKWRKQLETKKLSEENFLSKNAWECLELNCAFLVRLAKNGNGNVITLCNSQSCEAFFRNLRSMTTFGLTQINFSIQECIARINQLDVLESIKSDLQKKDFRFEAKYEGLFDKFDPAASQTDTIITTMTESAIAEIIAESSVDVDREILKHGISEGEVVLRNYFKFPTITDPLIIEMRKYISEYYNVSSIELEHVLFEEEQIEQEHVVFKNVRLLNLPSVDKHFKRFDINIPGFYEDFKISKFIWMIQDDIERVSTDRLFRYHNRKANEWKPEPLAANVIVRTCQTISLGDVVCIKHPEVRFDLIGKVVKFRNAGTVKKEKRYRYSTIYFHVNKNTDFMIYPVYYLKPNSNVIERIDYWCKWLNSNNYKFTINQNQCNFKERRVDIFQ